MEAQPSEKHYFALQTNYIKEENKQRKRLIEIEVKSFEQRQAQRMRVFQAECLNPAVINQKYMIKMKELQNLSKLMSILHFQKSTENNALQLRCKINKQRKNNIKSTKSKISKKSSNEMREQISELVQNNRRRNSNKSNEEKQQILPQEINLFRSHMSKENSSQKKQVSSRNNLQDDFQHQDRNRIEEESIDDHRGLGYEQNDNNRINNDNQVHFQRGNANNQVSENLDRNQQEESQSYSESSSSHNDAQLYHLIPENSQNHPREYIQLTFGGNQKRYSTYIKPKRLGIDIPAHAHYLFHKSNPINFNIFFNYDWSNLIEMNLIACRLNDQKFNNLLDHVQIYPNVKILYLSYNNLWNVTQEMINRFARLMYINFGQQEKSRNPNLTYQSIQEIRNYRDHNLDKQVKCYQINRIIQRE